jgi:predicted esterase
MERIVESTATAQTRLHNHIYPIDAPQMRPTRLLEELEFKHVFLPSKVDPSTAPTLLMLHGTGGNEQDLLVLGRMIGGSEANYLSPRGKVSEFGATRFFRRLAEGVFDIDDLKFRAAELREFVLAASNRYGFDAGKIIAVGYSNGANIAGAVLMLFPTLFAGAVQLRPMIPFEPELDWTLPHTPILVSSGSLDPTVSLDHAQRWTTILSQAGADVRFHQVPSGHGLTQQDVDAAKTWFASMISKTDGHP